MHQILLSSRPYWKFLYKNWLPAMIISLKTDMPCWTDYLQERPTIPEKSGSSGEYVVNLDYSGSSVKVDVELVTEEK